MLSACRRFLVSLIGVRYVYIRAVPTIRIKRMRDILRIRILYQAYDKNIFALHNIRPTSMNIPAANCTVTFNIDGTNTIIDTNNLRGLKECDVVVKYARGIEGL